MTTQSGVEDLDMPVNESSGASKTMLKQGYEVLDGGPARVRDQLLNSGNNVAETKHGGFLGRDEATDSESSKL